MPAGSASTSLSITNPLVLYRALIATKKIKPDPAQHRLALHLQKLYYRLKDYDPELEYRHRLDQISESAADPGSARSEYVSKQRPLAGLTAGRFIPSYLSNKAYDGTVLALTRTIPVHESAISIQSPQGMMLYGEVGRGKSMLLDLLADSLPSRKKRRWHFNTFMLDIFRRLEKMRIDQLNLPREMQGMEREHSILSLAKETIATSPVLFLDEFQLPDRVASKLLNGFMTSFFHLGGVLIASSNRMPDELAKASGLEFSPSQDPVSKLFGWYRRRSEGERGAQGDFGQFLEVLKARCEVWEMEGERDWRRDYGHDLAEEGKDSKDTLYEEILELSKSGMSSGLVHESAPPRLSQDTPLHYHIYFPSGSPSAAAADDAWTNMLQDLNTAQKWVPSAVHVYGRSVHIPATSTTQPGISLWTFSQLCCSLLGPADYITIASTYHTLILTEIPVLTLLQKNEARRFITLLDALYESKCRLLIRAEAPPDRLFFPETRSRNELDALGKSEQGSSRGSDSESVYQETFSEIYQDSTAPFRPNISLYIEEDTSSTPTQSILNPSSRSVLADEDADFGPVYGNGRGHGTSTGDLGIAETLKRQGQGPDFTNVSQLTGEDERFAYKRARSRLWEMCGERWWSERKDGEISKWWTPVGAEVRFWETLPQSVQETIIAVGQEEVTNGSHDGGARRVDQAVMAREKEEGLFRHGASPFRTSTAAPPKFGWQHAWGMVSWGKKAGEWGKGVEGDRRKTNRARNVHDTAEEHLKRGD